MLTTPLQLAHATAIFANRGEGLKPHLLLESRDNRQHVIPALPQPIPRMVYPGWAWGIVIDAMEGVITEPHGTGHRFGHPHYRVAAKTGTAQVFSIKENERYNINDVPLRLRDHSLFIAFAPIDNPSIAIAVVVENNVEAPLNGQ